MKSEDNYKQLRSLIVEKISTSLAPKKPSTSKLLKMKDKELVESLFNHAIIAERRLIREEVYNEILKINPKIKLSTHNTILSLIYTLINEHKKIDKL